MSTLTAALADVFDRGAERRLSVADERAAIAAAKRGDERATLDLIYAYAATLRNTVARYRNAGNVWDGWTLVSPQHSEDARSTAVYGLIEAIHAFDLDGPHERLAAIAWEYVTQHFSQEMAAIEGGAAVPSRTLTRFYGILNAADRDVHKARELAPQYQMSRETFEAVLSAVRAGRVEDETDDEGRERVQSEARPLWVNGDAFEDASDRILCEVAFAAVDGVEEDICRLAYGFADYDPQPDAEIAHRLGMSRPAVQRRRAGALAKMRDALGA